MTRTPDIDGFVTPGGIPVTVVTWPRPETPTGLRTVEDHAAQAGVPVGVGGDASPEVFDVHVRGYLRHPRAWD